MPWTDVTYREEINRFVLLARSGRFTVTELCEQFGTSRKTGYEHLERSAALGLAGLPPRRHRPHHSPARTEEAVEALMLAERRLHHTRGPKRLPAVFAAMSNQVAPPLGGSLPRPSPDPVSSIPETPMPTHHRIAPSKPNRCAFAAIVSALSFTGAAHAQITSPPKPAAPTTNGPLVLSPFEVRSSVDTGYFGQDTLAGTRLRTNLKDIAAAISPMTAEFLRDIAVTDVNSAMEYGLGTRVDTEDGSAAAVGGAYTALGGGPRSIRIRGLPGGGRSLNFFGAPGEVDLYLVDQIQVSRGPNSILYPGFFTPNLTLCISQRHGAQPTEVTERTRCLAP